MYDLKSLLDHVISDIYLGEDNGYSRYLILEMVDGNRVSVQIPSYLHEMIDGFERQWDPSDIIVDEFGSYSKYYDAIDYVFDEDDLPF